MQNDNKYKAVFIDSVDDEEDAINIREAFEKYSYYWKLFLLGIIISLIVAFIYLRYVTHQYEVSATILIDDKENGRLNSELSAFEDLGLFEGSKTTLDTEMGILKSRTLMENVIKDLELNVTYYAKGRIAINEIYQEKQPFNINFFISDSVMHKLDTTFSIGGMSDTNYELYNSEGDRVSKNKFGELITCKFGNIIVTPTNINNNSIEEVIIKFSPLKEVASKKRERLRISPESNQSNLLILSLKDPVRLKAQAILNNLIWQYNKNAVEDKSQIAKNTDKFINERLKIISSDLSEVDMGVEEFKTKNKLTDISAEAGMMLESRTELNKKIVELNTQIKLVDYLINYIRSSKDDLIPTNLGLPEDSNNSNSIKTNTLNYNELLLERNRLLSSSSELNPKIINLNEQITKYKESIIERLYYLKSSLRISLNENKRQELRSNDRTNQIPKEEREIRDIQRQQQIIETLYLYLLQKREENSITLAVTVPNAKIIDSADGKETPVAPKKGIVYLIATLFGFIVPFTILYFRFLFDNKIHNVDDVESTLNLPILGDIPSAKSDDFNIIEKDDKSNIAEAFRLVRTNVNFMLPDVNKESKTIFITSTLEGEGKTFISINLASSLSLLNKKVLLIGADIRKPKIASYLNIDSEKGLTNYLIDDSLQLNNIIEHNSVGNFDVITSGPIPPNPSELLTNGRFDEILTFGNKNYDYIIVDTAPVNIVTDTLILGRLADLFIYVIRANHLDKRMLKVPKMMYENKRLPNMTLLVNDIKYDKRGYTYGYGQKEPAKPWWKSIISF